MVLKNEQESPGRRRMLQAVCGAFGLVVAGSIGAMVRFLFPTVLYEPPAIFKAGNIEDYREGYVSTRWMKEHNIFVVRREGMLYGVDATCTHLGCATNWFAEEGLFKCPCHGSNFKLNGDVVAGPAPSPLYRVAVSLTPEEIILVNKRDKTNKPGEQKNARFWLRA